MPYQIDYLARAPYPGTPDGYYYWTNAWIINASTDSQAISRFTFLDSRVQFIQLDVLEQVRAQFKRSPGLGGVYHMAPLHNEHGLRPSLPGGASLLNYMKVNLFVGDRLVGYKRWRMPFPNVWAIDAEWPSVALNTVNGAFTQLINNQILAARDGSIITKAVADPLVRQWQLRHGTKRRIGPVFA